MGDITYLLSGPWAPLSPRHQDRLAFFVYFRFNKVFPVWLGIREVTADAATCDCNGFLDLDDLMEGGRSGFNAGSSFSGAWCV